MAVFTSSALTLRKKMIIDALRKAGAQSPKSAKSLSETDLEKPDSFQEYTDQLADMDVIHQTPDGKYYVDSED
jgi:hypothetical protein